MLVPVTQAKPDHRIEALRITMVGHATLLIQASGVNLLTDPVWSPRFSPIRSVGPLRVTEPGIAFEDLPPIDAVVLSHNHYDHMDLATLARLHAVHAPLMVLGNDTIVRHAVPGARIAIGDWHDRMLLADGVATTLTPATHWSGRGIRDCRMALWAGFYVETPIGASDSPAIPAKATARSSESCMPDTAPRMSPCFPLGLMVPAGSWPRSTPIRPKRSRSCRTSVPGTRSAFTGGTFPLSDEPREAPPALLATALVAAGLPRRRFVAAQPGEVLTMPSMPNRPLA